MSAPGKAINAGGEAVAVDELFAPRAACRVKRLFAEFRSAFPDWREEIMAPVAEEDTVAGCFRCSGTHLGEFLGEVPTGRRMEVEEVFFLRAEDGKFVTSGRWRTACTVCASWDFCPQGAASRSNRPHLSRLTEEDMGEPDGEKRTYR